MPNNQIINFDIAEPKFSNKATYVKGDVRELNDLENALSNFPCDTIISLAAEHKDLGISERADYFGREIIQKNIPMFIVYLSIFLQFCVGGLF